MLWSCWLGHYGEHLACYKLSDEVLVWLSDVEQTADDTATIIYCFIKIWIGLPVSSVFFVPSLFGKWCH